ncbi:XRE family transcriptional regulator [Streptomyces sp. WAC 06783]|uniref:helix-turn-helix domain-containing protein n=1 Tax=Streptomyces sp. WAC 06783 TaxID=2203211 RepID=UPI000F745E8C|nr:helix-turn-helix transcriptional regulator [Streptomyces sp. WAC 06783]RSO06915.1 XRE family transcriptional regulator [Streptomyces sp. WAC 06783]
MSVVPSHSDGEPWASVHPLGQGSRREAAARLLGEQLRRMRQERGLALKNVAPLIRGSVSKVSRLERGESPPKERDVFDLIRHYGATAEQRREIDSLLRQTQDSAWWQQYSDVTPNFLKRLIGLEDAADKIYTYENHVVPGILQIRDYARVLVAAAMPSAPPEAVERPVELRMARQQLLSKPNPPEVIALMEEGILRRPVGGPGVMCAQLEHLKRVAELPHVQLRIVEFEYGASAAPTYPITHLRFGDGGPAELVYVELLSSAQYLTKTAEVEQHRHVLAELSTVSASREKSAQMLDEALERYRRELHEAD